MASVVVVLSCETDLASNRGVERGLHGVLEFIKEEQTRRPGEYSGAAGGIDLHHDGALSCHNVVEVDAGALQLSVTCSEGEGAGERNLLRIGRGIAGAIEYGHGGAVEPASIRQSPCSGALSIEDFHHIAPGFFTPAFCRSRLLQHDQTQDYQQYSRDSIHVFSSFIYKGDKRAKTVSL